MQSMTRRLRLIALTAAGLVVLAACGTALGDSLPGGGSSDDVDLTPVPRGTVIEDGDTDNLPGWASSWGNTDFSRRTVNLQEINSGGVPRDGIPPIDNPQYVDFDVADTWIEPQEPVIQIDLDGDARAYPLQILTWHEIVNTEIAGKEVAVTFCPLCNSAVAFDRNVEGLGTLRLGVSGLLRKSDLVMWDEKTESLWQQITGEAIAGEMAGEKLTMLPSVIVSYEQFKDTHSNGVVLSRDTGFSRNYGSNPYAGYDSVDQSPFLFDGDLDDRLSPMVRVLVLELNGQAMAYPFTDLEEHPVVHDEVGGKPVVVFWQPGATSALDQGEIADSRDVGMATALNPVVDGERLTFFHDGGRFLDHETGSTWSFSGQAVAGPLEGEQLDEHISGAHFWFAWAAFQPDTQVWSP